MPLITLELPVELETPLSTPMRNGNEFRSQKSSRAVRARRN